jgi:hypothetical protein
MSYLIKLFLIIASYVLISTANAQSQNGKLLVEIVGAKGSCKIYWNFKNLTGMNITKIKFSPSYKEADGSIITKESLFTPRLKNGVDVEHEGIGVERIPCSQIKLIKLNQISYFEVDGDPRRDLIDKLWDATVVSSKVPSIKIVK